MTTRVAVLASGGGSNLQAILDHFGTAANASAAAVVLVASDRVGAGALGRARTHGVEAVALDASQRREGLAALLESRGIDLIALAGYLRFVPTDVTHRWRGRIVNVHPSLLPAFGGSGMFGLHVHQAVINAGVRVTGATVHFVDNEFDHGAVIAQWPVPVLATDTGEELARRVLEVEHVLYPAALHAVADGRISLGDDGVVRGAIGPSPSCARYALASAPTLSVADALFTARAP